MRVIIISLDWQQDILCHVLYYIVYRTGKSTLNWEKCCRCYSALAWLTQIPHWQSERGSLYIKSSPAASSIISIISSSSIKHHIHHHHHRLAGKKMILDHLRSSLSHIYYPSSIPFCCKGPPFDPISTKSNGTHCIVRTINEAPMCSSTAWLYD